MGERLQSVQQTWVNADGKTRKTTTDYDEDGNAVESDKKDKSAEIPQGELPADFPGRDIYRRAGYNTIEALRAFRRHGPFTRIEGIDSLTSQATELIVATTPGDAAEASAASAKATGLKTVVSKTGGGTEASGFTVGGKVGAGAAPSKAGHGVEGFLVPDEDDPDGVHATTNLSLEPGATKVSGTSDGGVAGEAQRPEAVVGDEVKVGSKKGTIAAVDGGVATKIKLADGTEVTDVAYTYVDADKAKADKEWQKVKE